MRIFIGPTEISGVAQGLHKGFCELEVESEVILSAPHPFQYDRPVTTIWWQSIWLRLGKLRGSVGRNKPFWVFAVAMHRLWGWVVLFFVLSKFDAFIFIFGQTITNSRFELWLLRRLSKNIIFIYLGSDTRPPYIDGGTFPGKENDSLPSAASLKKITRRRKRRLKIQENYADYLINSPAIAHFHERPYINWHAMGVPREIVPSRGAKVDDGRTVRILHSPSNPTAKGTLVIMDVIDRLKKKGHSIDLIKIQGMPNEHVLQELDRCDFVIDQLYSDSPMAGFATEAAFFGKPSVVGGYFSSKIEQYVPEDILPPSYFVEPEQIEAAVERMIVDLAFRRELGEKAQYFVKNQWNSKAVARRYLQLLNDTVPPVWWCDPKNVFYLEGGGLTRVRVQRLVTMLLKHGGVSALQLADKPELESAFCELAECQSSKF